MSLTPKNAILSVSWSLLSLVQGIVRSVLWPYLFLTYWPSDKYASWVIIFSVYAMVIYVSEGYIRYTINEYNLRYFQNKPKAYSYLNTSLRFIRLAYIAISVFAGLLLLSGFDFFGLNTLTVGGMDNRICFLLILLTGFTHSYSKYILYALEPTGMIHVAGQYVTVYGLAELVFGCIAAITAFKLSLIFSFYFLGLFLISVFFVSRIVRSYSLYRDLFSADRKENKGTGIFAKSLFFLTNNFLEKMVLDGLNFMITFFYRNVNMLLSFSTTRTMSNMPLTSTNAITSTFGIEYQRLNTTKNGNGVMSLLNMIWVLTGGIVNLGIVILYPFFKVLYSTWTHGKLPINDGFFYLIFSVAVLNVYGTNIIFYLKSLNITYPLFFVSAIRLLMVCVIMAAMPKTLLNIGLSLFITEAFINIIVLNVILYFQLNKMGCQNIWMNVLRSISPFLLTVIFLLIKEHVPFSDLYKMPFIIVVLGVIYFFQLRASKNNQYLLKSKQFAVGLIGRKRS